LDRDYSFILQVAIGKANTKKADLVLIAVAQLLVRGDGTQLI